MDRDATVMWDDEPKGTVGLPDAGGRSVEPVEATALEPTEEQLDLIRADLERIAEGVRPHLTDGFTVTTRLNESREGPVGQVLVAFPTGSAIGPSVPISAEMFEGDDDPEWEGPIEPEEIESMSRRIASIAVAQWANLLGSVGRKRDLPAK